MTRTRWIVVVSFCLAFVAGALAGYAASRIKPARPERGSWIADELNLTSEQRERMKAIWSEAHEAMQHLGRDRRRQLRQQRDQAVEALLNDAQKTEYDRIQQEYDEAVAALDAERRKVFETVDRKTREMLNPEQIEKFEQMRKKHRDMRNRPRHMRRRPGGPPPEGAGNDTE